MNQQQELLNRITYNPQQCGGKPCIRCMRIRVTDILEMLALNVEVSEILADFPDLEAEDIQAWHKRVAKAKSAGRLDLAQRAQEREATLLRQGNQLWGQMEAAKQQLANGKTLLTQIRKRKEELQAKARQAQATQAKTNDDTKGWNETINYNTYNKATDPLEAEFKKWELDDELDQLKRNM